jgi:5'-3' exonuclease
MIIVDYNAIAIAGVITQKMQIDEHLIRHMILNTIRMYNKKFRDEYGEMVIACDHASWRKEVFPQYKASRKKGREESSLDWNEIFRIINQVREEIRDNMPYKVIHVERCEADDIIGTLVYDTQEFGRHQKVIIISADKDFIQLHKFNNVRQYSPMQKKFVENENPRLYAFEHILKGDSGDGVPNVLSEDNVFVEGIRQTPLSKKKMDAILQDLDDGELLYAASWYRNYQRNDTSIIALIVSIPRCSV